MLNWLTIVVGLVALFAGYKLNQYANKQSEDRIIAQLTALIESLKNKQARAIISGEEQARLNGLIEALSILTNKY